MPKKLKLKYELIGGELYRLIEKITDVRGKSQTVIVLEDELRGRSVKLSLNIMWLAEFDASTASIVKEVKISSNRPNG